MISPGTDSVNNSAISRARRFIDVYLFPAVLVLLPFSFPYPSFAVFNLLTILLFVLCLIKGDMKKRIGQVFKNKFVLLFCSTYFIFAVCLLYSENLARGGFLLEKRLPLLAFPIILCTEKISDALLKKILLSFVFSCVAATLLSLLTVDYRQVQEYYWIGVELFRESFRDLLELDPPYFGLYIAFSIIVTAFYLIRDWKRTGTGWKLGGSFVLIYLVVIDIVLSARMSLIALVLFAGMLFIYFLIKDKKFRLPGTIMLILGVSLLVYAFKNFEFINRRFEEITATEWAPPRGIHYNSTNLRIGIFYCTADLLRDNWFLGLGTGDVQKNLNACYQANGFSDVMYLDEYNTHSEYFNIWLNTGLVGLALFLLSLFIPLKVAFQRNYFLYLSFLVLIILSCVTESVLERQKGIVFYAFFNALFAFNSIGITKSTDKK